MTIEHLTHSANLPFERIKMDSISASPHYHIPGSIFSGKFSGTAASRTAQDVVWHADAEWDGLSPNACWRCRYRAVAIDIAQFERR